MKRKRVVSFLTISLLVIALPGVCLAWHHPHSGGWGVGVSFGPGYYYPDPYPYPYVGIGLSSGLVLGPDGCYVSVAPAPIVVECPPPAPVYAPVVVVREAPVITTSMVVTPRATVVKKAEPAPVLQPVAPASDSVLLPTLPTSVSPGSVAPQTFSLEIAEVGDLRNLGGQIRAPFTQAFLNAGFKVNADPVKWTQYQVRVEVASAIQPVDSNGVRRDSITLRVSTKIVNVLTGQTLTLSNQTPFQQTIVSPEQFKQDALQYVTNSAADAAKQIQK